LILWVILFVACMVGLRFGAGGLESVAIAGAMVVAGLGVRSFLNTFWRKKDQTDPVPPKTRFWTRSASDKYRRGLFRVRRGDFQRDYR
jgi:hypothetical protein